MKADVMNAEGQKSREIELPEFFSSAIREDIVTRIIETQKNKQPYAPYAMAGKQASASGKIRHGRRKWRTAYGKGISRVPRKIMWRRGDQFYWIAAEISSSRKGRRAHPPKVLSMMHVKKINKKELILALKSALSATAHPEYVKKRYSTLGKISFKLPLVVDGTLLGKKSKEIRKVFENILGDALHIAFQEKTVRAGKGKLRGRRYKQNAGMLFVIGNQEKISLSGIDVQKASMLSVSDLAEGALGRLTLYTEKALQDLQKRLEGNHES